MSDTAVALKDPELDPDHSLALGYVEEASRYDGSRTPAHKIALIHHLHRQGRSQTEIARLTASNPYVVKAVLARADHLVLDARNLLKANALGFAGDAIQASQEAAKRGKGDVSIAMLDRLGVTEPPKSQQTNQVAVQVVLNGGTLPNELSVTTQQATTPDTVVIDSTHSGRG